MTVTEAISLWAMGLATLIVVVMLAGIWRMIR